MVFENEVRELSLYEVESAISIQALLVAWLGRVSRFLLLLYGGRTSQRLLVVVQLTSGWRESLSETKSLFIWLSFPPSVSFSRVLGSKNPARYGG